MSSGEADAYTLTIRDTSNTTMSDWWPSTTWSTLPAHIYLYQITCPRCDTLNWGQVDITITCKGKIGKKDCGARLKAVTDQVDYEVPVVKP